MAGPPMAGLGVAGFAGSRTLRLLARSFLLATTSGLQCYGCNVMVGSRSVNTGCSSPEVVTCPRSHQGFKHRFCIKMESAVPSVLLTSGCATSHHCQQQELPGIWMRCCNRSPTCSSCPVCCLLILGTVLLTFLLWSRAQRRQRARTPLRPSPAAGWPQIYSLDLLGPLAAIGGGGFTGILP